MKILINIRNIKIIEKEKIYTGNVNTYIINVEYEDYNFFSEYNCYLTFKNNDLKKKVIIGPDLKVIIPFDVLSETGNLIIGFFAIKVDEKEKLIRYSSEIEVLPVEKGGFDEEASEPEELTPTILEKYLQEMKNFYNESLEEFNRNATNKTEEFNKNYEDKIKSYNDNSIQKTNEYNKNADEKIKEINNKVSDIEKIEDNLEQIQKNVQTSEQNAKTSETNAKTSEINAQNSAKNASEIETNIISIQEDINKSKGEINTAKESVDKSLEKVYSAVTEATNQAKESKKQAGIATSKANQTSEDRTVVETMKSDVSSMKTSVEQTKTDTEQIKNDTQAIKNDTEALKEETLQAKEEVENSLENERIESDKRYSRAIDSEIIEINEFGQVECDDNGYMKDVEIESTLPEITQDTREGYNKFNIDTITENKYIYANNSNTDPYYGKLNNSNSSNTSDYIPVSENTNYLLTYDYDTLLSGNERGYCFYDENKAPIVIDSIVNTLYSVTNKKATFITPTSAKYLRFSYDKNCNNIQLIEGTEEKPYEEYGATPTLNYPSEFKNILSSFNIKNTVDEIEKYDKQITLPENKFLGTFNGYKNYINDDKLRSNLKIVEFNGTENFYIVNGEEYKGFALQKNTTILASNVTSRIMLSNYFKCVNSGESWKGKNTFGFSYNDVLWFQTDDDFETIDDWKSFLAQQKQAGTPLQILYISNEEETELEEINLQLYQGINNISLEDLKLNFKYNISIEKYIEKNNENERKISDSKYARALKTKVEDVEQTQIYAENDEVENLTIKGAELTQKTREGYNQLKNTGVSRNHNGIDFIVNSDGTVLANGTATGGTSGSSISQINIHDEEIQFEAGDYTIQDCKAYVVYEDDSYEWFDGLTKATSKTFDKSFKITDAYIQVNPEITVNNKLYYPMILKGTENKPYEEYGASPSLNYPSEIQVKKEQNISICRKNILDTNDINKSSSGIATISKNDGGININGTSTSTFLAIKSVDLNVPIKAGTKLFMNYGKTEKLLKDNTDFSPYFWLVNKNGTLFKTLNRNNIINGYSVEQEIYRISFGIEALVVGKEYSEDIYIELEISDKQPTQFQKYEAIDISIALENGFNGALKDYYNEIKKLDGKWYLVNKFARYVLDGVTVGKKVTAKQSKNNIDKYDVMLGTDKIYINTSKDYWKPTLGICNYLKSDKTYGTISDINSTYTNAIGFWKSGQDQMSFSTEKDRFASIDEANAYLKQLYDAGNPLEFYVLMSEDNYETIELPEEVKQELNKFKLYDDLNNVFIDKGSLSFKYNKSLLRAFKEQSELSASLLDRIQALEQAQVNQVGGN